MPSLTEPEKPRIARRARNEDLLGHGLHGRALTEHLLGPRIARTGTDLHHVSDPPVFFREIRGCSLMPCAFMVGGIP